MEGVGCRVKCEGCWVQGVGCRVQNAGGWVQESGVGCSVCTSASKSAPFFIFVITLEPRVE